MEKDKGLIQEFLDLVDVEKPDEIMFAPPCAVWCQLGCPGGLLTG